MMNELERARDKRDTSGPWEISKVMCLVCQHQHLSVHPLYKSDGEMVDLNTLQCPDCKNSMSEVLPFTDEELAILNRPGAPPAP